MLVNLRGTSIVISARFGTGVRRRTMTAPYSARLKDSRHLAPGRPLGRLPLLRRPANCFPPETGTPSQSHSCKMRARTPSESYSCKKIGGYPTGGAPFVPFAEGVFDEFTLRAHSSRAFARARRNSRRMRTYKIIELKVPLESALAKKGVGGYGPA